MFKSGTANQYKFIQWLSLGMLCIIFALSFIPQSADNPLMQVTALALSASIIATRGFQGLQWRSPILISLFSLWALWLLGAATSLSFFDSAVTFSVVSIIPLSLISFAGANWSTRHLKIFTAAILAIATGIAVQAILSVTVFHNVLFGTRSNGPFDDPNLLGAFLACALPVPLFLFLNAKEKLKIILYAAIIGILGAGLLTTQSRSALLALALIAPLMLWQGRKMPHYRAKILGLITLALAAFCATFPYIDLIFRIKLMAEGLGEANVVGRIAIFKGAFEMFKVHPFFGYGLGTFHAYYPPYRIAGDNSGGFWVHNDLFQWAIECGILTPLTFLAFFALVIRRLWQKSNELPAAIALSMALILFITSLLVYTMHINVITMLVFGAIGIGLSHDLKKQGVDISEKINRAEGMALALVGILMLALMPLVYTLNLYQNAQYARYSTSPNAYRNALKDCVDNGMKSFHLCRMSYMQLMLVNAKTMLDREEYFRLAEEVRQSAGKRADADAMLGRYYHYGPDKDLAKAETYYLAALGKNPSSWAIRNDVINLLLTLKKNEEAERHLIEGFKYPIPKPAQSLTLQLVKRMNLKLELKK